MAYLRDNKKQPRTKVKNRLEIPETSGSVWETHINDASEPVKHLGCYQNLRNSLRAMVRGRNSRLGSSLLLESA